MSEQQNNNPRQATVNTIINWAKTGWSYHCMVSVVSNYLN